LNYDNPEVHEAIFKVVDFWLDLGVDGLRLDAVPYLYESEGTNCENLPETHAFLKKLRAHVDEKYRDRMLLAEANQWPEAQGHSAPHAPAEPVKLLKQDIPGEIAESIGSFLESARLLGERTGELHLALASDPEDPDFAPVPFTPQYQRGVFQSMRTVAARNLRLLRKQLKTLPADLQPPAQRIRIHSDLHLGQMLWTGKDFAFVDFESETATA
jgi:hypothetical protein